MSARITALVATYRRPRELARLLESLGKLERPLERIVIVDNAGCEQTRAAVAAAPCPAELIVPGQNLGCGGGLRRAGEEAVRLPGESATHFLVLDDDAVLQPGTLEALLRAMEAHGAEAACPLVLGPGGTLGWLPGLATRRVQHAADAQPTPEAFRAALGSDPLPFVWTQGICLLVTRRAVEACGWHRDDFWVRGEDLDFSLRLTARFQGLLVPEAVCEHLPPPAATPLSSRAEYLRHAAMVQNVACLGLRLPHGRRIAWTIPSVVLRFLRMWGLGALPDAARALLRGAGRCEPAGRGAGETFFARFQALG